MRAVLLDGYGGPDRLRPGEASQPTPGADQVLIRVEAIGVNPADIKWRLGMFQDFRPLSFPHIPGYDVAGVVAYAPPGSSIAEGARVAAMLDLHGHGAYAEFAVARAADLALLPDGLSFEAAAAVPTPGLAGVQMIEDQLDVQPGQALLITGALGAVGRFAVWAAKARGGQITAAVRASRHEAAFRLGVDEVVSLGATWTGHDFDRVADTIGGAEVAALCRHVPEQGRISTVATLPIPAEDLAAPPIFFGVRPDGPSLLRLLKALSVGELDLPVAQILPLQAAAEAHRLVDAGGLGGRVILTP